MAIADVLRNVRQRAQSLRLPEGARELVARSAIQSNPVTAAIANPTVRKVVSAPTRAYVGAVANDTQRLRSEGRNFEAAIRPLTLPVQATANFGADIVRAVPRQIISAGLEPAAGLAGLVTGRKVEPVFTPSNRFERTVFGTQPIEGVFKRYDRNQETARGVLESVGVKGRVGGFGASVLGVPLVAGMTALDLTPGGGGAKQGAKEVTERLVKKYGDEVLDVVKALSKGDSAIVQKTDPRILSEVTDALKNVREDVAKVADDILATRKVSKLKETVTESPSFSKEIGDQMTATYQAINNKDTLAAAAKTVRNNFEGTRSRILTSSDRLSAENVAEAKLITERLLKEGKTEEAVDFLDEVTKKATELGQAVQAFAIWSKLTPSGALRYATKQIENANQGAKALGLKGDVPKLSKVASDAIVKQAGEVQKMIRTTGEGSVPHREAVAKLQALIATQVPATIGQKASTLQTMAQLLNVKTFTRNIIGNTGFAGLENLSGSVAAGIDAPLSLLTGVRSKTLPNLVTQGKGAIKGFGSSVRDIRQGINTRNFGSKFDLNNRLIFQKFDPKTGELSSKNMLAKAEKLLRFSLEPFDRAGYQAAYDDTTRELLKLLEVNNIEPTPRVIEAIAERANFDGLYRTFQDSSFIAKALSGLKRGLNFGKNFGIGDVVLKYPKTPGNILSRGLEYSPAAFVELALDIASSTIPFGPAFFRNYSRSRTASQIGGNLEGLPEAFVKLLNQRRLVQKGGRALTGSSALVANGALLHRLGIVTGKSSVSDKDEAGFNKTTGLKDYRINTSALKRFVLSGFRPEEAKAKDGDLMMSYDWLAPASIPFVVGASLDEGFTKGDKNWGELMLGIAEGSVIQSLESIVDQSSFKGAGDIYNAIKYTGEGESAIGNVAATILGGIPASFIPTIINQFATVLDPKARDIVGDSVLETGLNKAINRVPGLRSVLPKTYDSFGQEIKYNQDSLVSKKGAGVVEKVLATFFSPMFYERMKLTPEAELVIEVAQKTGDGDAYPRLVAKSQQVGSMRFSLDAKQKNEMQRVLGNTTRKFLEIKAQDQVFLAKTPEEQAKEISEVMSELHNTYKYRPFMEYLGVEVPEGVSTVQIKKAYETLSKDDRYSKLSKEKLSKLYSLYFESLK